VPTSLLHRRRVRAVAIGAALASAGTFVLASGAQARPDDNLARRSAVQMLRVDTPTLASRNQLNLLGLDVTEHGGNGFLDVVAHTRADRDRLSRAGYTFTVVVADMAKAEEERIRADKAYAAAKPPGTSGLPSGRNAYRVLADYDTDLTSLATTYPSQARAITLAHPTLEGRTVRGVEIATDVLASDGRPTTLILGLHHAREWPSSELAIEFATDLLKNSADPRIKNVLDNSRVVVVPVVNPDGFNVSRTLAYEMKRKNCRLTDGQLPGAGQCALGSNAALGTDPNRNYGGFWGGPGASTSLTSETYRGAGPFSEPETQNVRELISARQVTTMISNHTYSNLVLRPPGFAAGGLAPDETILKSLGDAMAGQMGYTSQFGYQLYDTTGTTEDWSYFATGGLGYTFEHGTNSFHPKFSNVVDMYTGARKLAGKGARGAFLLAAENSIDATRHSIVQGTAPAGVTLRLKKSFTSNTWSSTIPDVLDSTMVVPTNGSYVWHVNPSTRPLTVRAGGTESYTLTCENPSGTVLQTQSVTVARGAAVTENLTC
jgi:carboxypeptidase T